MKFSFECIFADEKSPGNIFEQPELDRAGSAVNGISVNESREAELSASSLLESVGSSLEQALLPEQL